MKLIAGLGNPGAKYDNTRHNAGFMAVDFFLRDHNAIACESKFNAQICEYHQTDSDGNIEKIFFVKPQSYMNLSGEVLREILAYYKLDHSNDLLVLQDEKDLPFGTVKEAMSSGSAGHNGVQNIIDELGTKDFARIRIGVESREADSPLPTDVFVLQKFTDEELEKLEKDIFPQTNTLIENFIK